LSIVGRRGHARVAVLTIIDEEMNAALAEFSADCNVIGTDYYVSAEHRDSLECVPFVITQSLERTNIAAERSVQNLIEDWRPEFVILCGNAAGIRRVASNGSDLEGPVVGDVVVASYVHNAEYNKAIKGELKARYLAVTPPSIELISSYCRPLRREQGWISKILLEKRPNGAIPTVHEGELVAVDGVMGDFENAHHAAIVARYDKAIGADMESHGVGFSLHSLAGSVRYNPRWICVRAVSDEVVGDPQAHALLEADPHVIRDLWREPAAATAAAFAHALVERLLRDELPPSDAEPAYPAYQRPALSVGDESVAP
jgi:nucleoside phosphorylase